MITEAEADIRAAAQVLAGALEAFRMMGVDVRFGEPGDSDIRARAPATWGSAAGKLILCECKREGFDPGKLRGEKRAHFDRQVERLKRTCDNGGYGIWVNDAIQVVWALTQIREGCRIVFDGDYPFMTDEEV